MNEGEPFTVEHYKNGRWHSRLMHHPQWYTAVRELHAEGLNDAEIGRLLGRPDDTVRQARNRLELEPNARVGRPRKEGERWPTSKRSKRASLNAAPIRTSKRHARGAGRQGKSANGSDVKPTRQPVGATRNYVLKASQPRGNRSRREQRQGHDSGHNNTH